MKTRMILAVSLAIALAAPAFAQDSSQSAPAPPASDQSADAQSMSADQQARHHRVKHRQDGQHYDPAYMALTGNEPKDVAYQYSDQQKTYPAVDHGHVPGDPPIIDHSHDQAPVTKPTTTTITIPPGG